MILPEQEGENLQVRVNEWGFNVMTKIDVQAPFTTVKIV